MWTWSPPVRSPKASSPRTPPSQGRGSRITTSGSGARALELDARNQTADPEGPASISLTDTVVKATGLDANGPYGALSLNFYGVRPNTLVLSGGSLTSEGTAIAGQGRLDISLDRAVAVSGLVALETLPPIAGGLPTVLNLTGTGASTLTGDSFVIAGASADVDLRALSVLTGAFTTRPGGLARVALDNATWNVTVNSNVTTSPTPGGSCSVPPPLGPTRR